MPLSISRSRISTWSRARRRGRRTGPPSRACEWTTLPAARSRTARQKIELHSLGRRPPSSRARITRPSAGSTTKNSSGCTRSLWTPVGASSRPPSVGRTADATARARRPSRGRGTRRGARRGARRVSSSLIGAVIAPSAAAAIAGPNGGSQHADVGDEAPSMSAGRGHVEGRVPDADRLGGDPPAAERPDDLVDRAEAPLDERVGQAALVHDDRGVIRPGDRGEPGGGLQGHGYLDGIEAGPCVRYRPQVVWRPGGRSGGVSPSTPRRTARPDTCTWDTCDTGSGGPGWTWAGLYGTPPAVERCDPVSVTTERDPAMPGSERGQAASGAPPHHPGGPSG